ncbi:hypothetical protein JW948_12935 [bacterium]|nr:hypothetical protein [bacterium]
MFLNTSQTAQKIIEGRTLYIAGDENLLRQLPKGEWIGGTISYFMTEQGGQISREKLFVQEQDPCVSRSTIKWYDDSNLENIVRDSPDQGFSIVIIPATSPVHIKYAEKAPDYEDLFYKQIIGWISGIHLDDLGSVTPKVMNGLTGELSDQKAVVLHAVLPDYKIASIGIINIFTQGSGEPFRFSQKGFQVKNCLINGTETGFADYLIENQIDIRLPLVANYHGAMVNVSFQGIDDKTKTVNFYAPVFRDIEYKIAAPVGDYVQMFQSRLPGNLLNPVFSCNCILNFLYSELEGKKTGNITGPITFGEIAYQLLNQTMVYLSIQDKAK